MRNAAFSILAVLGLTIGVASSSSAQAEMLDTQPVFDAAISEINCTMGGKSTIKLEGIDQAFGINVDQCLRLVQLSKTCGDKLVGDFNLVIWNNGRASAFLRNSGVRGADDKPCK
jgi:hypothetical protein